MAVPLSWSFFLFKQAVAVTVPVEHSHAPQLQPDSRAAFRVKLYHLNSVGGDEGNKGDEVLLFHGVVDGDVMLVLHRHDGNTVVIVRLFRFQRGKGNAAAADEGTSCAVYHISADRADVEFGTEHIGGNVFINNVFAVHQLNDRDIQRLGQGLQQGNIRQAFGGFPFGDCLAADTDPLRQLCLGQVPCFPKLLDGGTGYVGIHVSHFLSE